MLLPHRTHKIIELLDTNIALCERMPSVRSLLIQIELYFQCLRLEMFHQITVVVVVVSRLVCFHCLNVSFKYDKSSAVALKGSVVVVVVRASCFELARKCSIKFNTK